MHCVERQTTPAAERRRRPLETGKAMGRRWEGTLAGRLAGKAWGLAWSCDGAAQKAWRAETLIADLGGHRLVSPVHGAGNGGLVVVRYRIVSPLESPLQVVRFTMPSSTAHSSLHPRAP